MNEKTLAWIERGPSWPGKDRFLKVAEDDLEPEAEFAVQFQIVIDTLVAQYLRNTASGRGKGIDELPDSAAVLAEFWQRKPA